MSNFEYYINKFKEKEARRVTMTQVVRDEVNKKSIDVNVSMTINKNENKKTKKYINIIPHFISHIST